MTARTFLITGGTGFIGSALVRALLQEGHRVRSLDNDSRGSRNRLADVVPDVELIVGDVRDAEAVSRAVRGAECVCHLAAVNGTEFFYSQPDRVLDVAVKGIVNIIDACVAHGVGDLVVASSSEVYQTPPRVPTDETVPLSIPNPMNPRYSYGAGKIISEMLAIHHGRRHFQRVTIFRPHNVYGPDMGWEHVIPQFVLRMRNLSNGTSGRIRFPILGTGRETRAFVFIDDLTDGLLRVIHGGEHLGIYNIGGQEEIAIEMLAHEVGRYFGRDVVIEPGPPAEGSPPRRCPDISKLSRLGYRATFGIREGLPPTVEWYIANWQRCPRADRKWALT